MINFPEIQDSNGVALQPYDKVSLDAKFDDKRVFAWITWDVDNESWCLLHTDKTLEMKFAPDSYKRPYNPKKQKGKAQIVPLNGATVKNLNVIKV